MLKIVKNNKIVVPSHLGLIQLLQCYKYTNYVYNNILYFVIFLNLFNNTLENKLIPDTHRTEFSSLRIQK